MKAPSALLVLASLTLAGCNTMSDSPAGVRTLLIDDQLQYLDVANMINTYAISAGCRTTNSPTPLNLQPSEPPSQEEYYWARSRQSILKGSSTEDQRFAEAAARFYDRCYVAKISTSLATSNIGASNAFQPTAAGSAARLPAKSGTASGLAPTQTPVNDRAALLRNEIQDSMIAAANQRCHRWKSYFSTQSASIGFWAKTAGSVASAVSTAVNPANLKSGFSAASTISSDLDANFTEKYLQQKTTSVIYQGIDTRRATLINGIAAKRFKPDGSLSPLESYSLSAAVADAIEYHASCSVESGLQAAGEALTQQGTNEGGSANATQAPTKTVPNGADVGGAKSAAAPTPQDSSTSSEEPATGSAKTSACNIMTHPVTKSPVLAGAPPTICSTPTPNPAPQ